MKKVNASRTPPVKTDDIPETDFSKGVRGKHHKQYLASMVTVTLHPDVAQFFPDSESANKALRDLLRIRGIR